MTSLPLSSALLLLLAAADAPEGGKSERVPDRILVQTGQFSFHQRIIVRVPRMPGDDAQAPAASRAPARWVEKNTRKCVPLETLVGASVPTAESVDLVANDGSRMRARFADDCAALDFYSGFYIRPTSDGQVCAKRDVIRSRSGGTCRIEELRRLVPHR